MHDQTLTPIAGAKPNIRGPAALDDSTTPPAPDKQAQHRHSAQPACLMPLPNACHSQEGSRRMHEHAGAWLYGQRALQKPKMSWLPELSRSESGCSCQNQVTILVVTRVAATPPANKSGSCSKMQPRCTLHSAWTVEVLGSLVMGRGDPTLALVLRASHMSLLANADQSLILQLQTSNRF